MDQRIFPAVTLDIENAFIWYFFHPVAGLNDVFLPCLQFDQLCGIRNGGGKPPLRMILRNVAEDGQLIGVDRIFQMRGDKNDLYIGQKGLNLFRKLHPGEPGHFDIQQEQVVEKMIVRDVVQQVAALGVGCNLVSDAKLLQACPYDFFMQGDRLPLVVADCDLYHSGAS